jgi:perosamine synthetase
MLNTNRSMSSRKSISAFPMPRARRLLSSREGSFAGVLASYCRLCDSGRAALYWACRGLSLAPGTKVWMPSFNCGVEVQAVLDAGFQVDFYRVCGDLTIDEEDLNRKLKARPAPVVVIHYFGFAQPGIQRLARLCQARQCVMIEDCAHALFSRHSGQLLGGFAPVAVFSLRKTLPIYDGGALQVTPSLLGAVTNRPFRALPSGRFSLEPYAVCLKAAVKRVIGNYVTQCYRQVRGLEQGGPAWTSPVHYDKRLSGLSRRLAALANPEAVVDRRRRNYSALDARLEGSAGYARVFETLPPGVCPLFLPVWVADRSKLMDRLRAEQIETHRFGASAHPSLDLDAFPETARLRDSILCLPVHEQIEESDLDRMTETLGPLLGRYGAL